MKIGINASFLRKPMTGIGQVSVNFLKQLAEFQISNFKFQDAKFVLYCQEAPQLDFQLPANFEVKVFLPWWKRDDIMRLWWWERQLSSEAIKDGCDVFFSLYQSATVFPEPTRHVMLVHDLIPRLFPEYRATWRRQWYYRATERAIGRATALLTPSIATKADLMRELGIESERITAIPLGVDAVYREKLVGEQLAAVLKKYSLAPGYLYHGGGLETRKNSRVVLEAYAALVRENLPNLPPLIISGQIHAETNPLATPVERIIAELGLESRVKLLGLVPTLDLPALYQGASMFLFPSRYEGFGLPVLEAYASGTPVITTRAGALAELTDHGEAMIVADAPSSEELVQVIRQLLSDHSIALRLRNAGETTSRQYSWESFAQKTLAALLQ